MHDSPTESGQEGPQQGPASPCLSTWDTAYVSPRDRFSYFREGVCQAFCAFSPERPPDRDIKARVERFDLTRGSIGRVHTTTPHGVSRRRTDVASIPDEILSLGLQLTGGMEGQQGGRPFQQKTGDVCLFSANQVMDFNIDRDVAFSTVAVIFPRSVLVNFVEIDTSLPLTLQCIEPLKSCFLLMNERLKQASQEEMTHLRDATLSLLMAALIKDRDFLEDRCTQEPATQRGILQAICNFIAQDIANPDLSTAVVAGHFGISPRYLQKLFASDDMTFKGFVTNLRLERICADLLDAAFAHVPANDIAFRWGFRDITTFHRNFKLRFGDTPRQMRSLVTSNLPSRLRSVA